MNIKIFISHKQEDSRKAEHVAKYIEAEYGFHTYVDTLDEGIKTSTNITDRIVGKLRDATHLLVIFSEKTKGSMWVPFELGVSYEREQGIGVLLWAETLSNLRELPEYLDEFPKLKVTKYSELVLKCGIENEKYKIDLDKFLQLIQKYPNERILREAMESESFGMRQGIEEVHYAKEFIDRLKREL